MRPGNNTGIGLRKGAWTADEDMLLKKCIEKYGEGKWHLVPLRTGGRYLPCNYFSSCSFDHFLEKKRS